MDEMIMERYTLCMERACEIASEDVLMQPLSLYFEKVSLFVGQLSTILRMVTSGDLYKLSEQKLREMNYELYADILPENYEHSYGNPDYITRVFEEASLPTEYAQALCFLYAELRGMIPYAFEERYDIVTLFVELFLEIYGMFVAACEESGKIDEDVEPGGTVYDVDAEESGLIYVPEADAIWDCLYAFMSDNCDVIIPDRVTDQINPNRDFATSIITDSDLSDLRYLYYYGEYVSDDEIKIARYLGSLSDEQIENMASTYTEGYRIGFVKAGKPLNKKRTVNIRYPLGFERVVRQAIVNFEKMGLKPTIYRAGSISLNKRGVHLIGYTGAVPNRQYMFDHMEDNACYLDADFVNRRLAVLRMAYEEQKILANGHAGPACIETFGEDPFTPVTKKTALKLSAKQQQLAAKYLVEAGNITNEYIVGSERSFTIIAYPIPQIGKDFKAIFDETVKLNTLDYVLYEGIQQKIIDTLDLADRVHVVGKEGNETDLWIQLATLNNPERETKFENCVADVNIPVGEVFTSPVLKGTNGLLHVKKVYLEGLLYKDLRIWIEDGCIKRYSLANFNSAAENEKYFKDNVLFHHDTLPMGEFAIGTNTTAYKMAKKYGIEERLPILIGEKTGPHFAFGDTCYSHEEDVRVYNPDKKEIIAKENDFSRMRTSDPAKAYFSCHTDITIPYDELGGIYADAPEGNIAIIEDGLFVLQGCDELNKSLK